MLKDSRNIINVANSSREENLASAKRALKRHRGSYLHRVLSDTEDIILVVSGQEILERHVCKIQKSVTVQSQGISTSSNRRVTFNIEEYALYR